MSNNTSGGDYLAVFGALGIFATLLIGAMGLPYAGEFTEAASLNSIYHLGVGVGLALGFMFNAVINELKAFLGGATTE